MNGFVVICLNENKVGYYIFSHFATEGVMRAKRPKFNSNNCLMNYKVYKDRSAAERTQKRLEAYYSYMPQIKTKVLTLCEWKDNEDWQKMEEFFRQ